MHASCTTRSYLHTARSFNSTVYATITPTSYYIYSVDSTYLMNSTFARSNPLGCGSKSSVTCNNAAQTYEAAVSGRLLNLTVDECIRQYAVPFQTDSTAVVLVSPNNNQQATTNYYSGRANLGNNQVGCKVNPYAWVCGAPSLICDSSADPTYCPTGVKGLNRNDWRPFNTPVSYCLVESTEENCMLQFTVPIAIIVIVCNLLKAVTLFFVCFRTSHEPLVTVGDAISSFLKTPDETTHGMCLLSRSDLSPWLSTREPGIYRTSIRRCANAVSGLRWSLCLTL